MTIPPPRRLQAGYSLPVLDKYTYINARMKRAYPPLRYPRPLDQMRERTRYRHYSLGTEYVYVY